jgi:hypothetical protein
VAVHHHKVTFYVPTFSGYWHHLLWLTNILDSENANCFLILLESVKVNNKYGTAFPFATDIIHSHYLYTKTFHIDIQWITL